MRDKLAAIPGHFTHTEFFSGSVAYGDVRGSITAPKSLPLKIENHDVAVERQETRDAVTYSWRYSAPAAQTVDRPSVSPLDRLPRILVSSLENHDELGRTYAALIAPKETVTPRIRALADQVTAGIADRRQQAEKIYEWVGKNIRYVAVDIGNGGIIPHDADVTLANGYGANLRLQNFADAIRDYDAALSVNRDLAASLFGRGVAKIRAGNAEQGNADITEALKQDPEVAANMAKYGLIP
jgi:tetratricopeptide (TPR) repeat protein